MLYTLYGQKWQTHISHSKVTGINMGLNFPLYTFIRTFTHLRRFSTRCWTAETCVDSTPIALVRSDAGVRWGGLGCSQGSSIGQKVSSVCLVPLQFVHGVTGMQEQGLDLIFPMNRNCRATAYIDLQYMYVLPTSRKEPHMVVMVRFPQTLELMI